MWKGIAIALTSVAVLGAVAAPALAKNAGAQKAEAEDKPASSSCHSYVQNPDGSWTPIPCQELGAPTHTQHKSRGRDEDEHTDR